MFQTQSATEKTKDLRILIIGKSGTGKSATGNTILGKNVFEDTVLRGNKKCKRGIRSKWDKWNSVTVVDTPGLDLNSKEWDTFEQNFVEVTDLLPDGIHVILLVLRVGRYTEEDQFTIKYFLSIFGDEIYDRLTVLFTCKDLLKTENMDIDEFVRDNIPNHLQDVIERSRHYVTFENYGSSEEKKSDMKKLGEKIDDIMSNNYAALSCDTLRSNIKIVQRIKSLIYSLQQNRYRILQSRMRLLPGEREETVFTKLYNYLSSHKVIALTWIGLVGAIALYCRCTK